MSTNSEKKKAVRNLVIVLGDQLDAEGAALEGFEAGRDGVWMAEVTEESTHVWSTKPRIAVFLAAMRHFRDELRGRGWRVEYGELEDAGNTGTLAGELERAVKRLKPAKLIVTQPGEWRVRAALEAVAQRLGVEVEERADWHFLCSLEEFRQHAAGRKQLRMEFFLSGDAEALRRVDGLKWRAGGRAVEFRSGQSRKFSEGRAGGLEGAGDV